MSERLDVYLADWCDHSSWVESFLKRRKPKNCFVYDCKLLKHRPGWVRATSRATGSRTDLECPGLPMVIRHTNPPRYVIGAAGVLKEFGPTILVGAEVSHE